MEISYSELRNKDVVNVLDGSRMGKMMDLIIDSNGKRVLGFVVPGQRKLFKPAEDIFVPWSNIVKIGSDVLLVSLDESSLTNVTRSAEMNLKQGGRPSKHEECSDCVKDDYL